MKISQQVIVKRWKPILASYKIFFSKKEGFLEIISYYIDIDKYL